MKTWVPPNLDLRFGLPHHLHHRLDDRLEQKLVPDEVFGENQDLHSVGPHFAIGSRCRLALGDNLGFIIFDEIKHILEPARRVQDRDGLLLDDPTGVGDVDDRFDPRVRLIGKPVNQRSLLHRFLTENLQ